MWDTSTLEGPFVFVGDDGMTVTGHYTEWFGDSINNKNFVSTATLNFVGRSSTGSVLSLHLEVHIGVSASGNPIFFSKTHC